MSLETLLQAVRTVSSPSTWSRGVELVRKQAVVTQKVAVDEVELRVSAKRGGPVAPEVVLFPEEDDWTCECGSREDVCEHVAASIIALRQAEREGGELPGQSAGAPAHVGYRLHARAGPLMLQRRLVVDEQEQPLPTSLVALAEGMARGPQVLVSQADLKLDNELTKIGDGVIPRQSMAEILALLSDAEDVTFEGKPVKIGKPQPGLCIRVREYGEGFVVRLEQDPTVTQVFDNGALRQADTVRAVGEHGLGERWFSRLRKGRVYGPDNVGNLVGQLLPRLRRKLPVLTETDRLPGSRKLRPRLQLVTERRGDSTMSVLAHVVYGDPPVARVDGKRLVLLRSGDVPIRNVKRERALIAELERVYGLEPGVRRLLPATDAIALREQLEQGGDDVHVVGTDHEAFFTTAPLQPRLEVDQAGHVEMWFEPGDAPREGEDGGTRVAASTVLDAWERGEQVAPLLAGGFGRLPTAWLTEHGHRVAGLLAAKEAAKAEQDTDVGLEALPDVVALCDALDQPTPPRFERLRTLLEDFTGIPRARLPADLRAELRPYQRLGVDWLAFLREAELGGLLADDMGLGKTLQALAVARGKTLVVAPTSVLLNWANEVRRFRPGVSTNIYHGTGRTLDSDADVTLTTYAILRLDVDALADREWDLVVLDEAQNIKNPDSKVARAAYRLRGRFRLALTGTPVENRLDDLWSEFHFLNRGLLGGRKEFQERYIKPLAAGDHAAAARLRERIHPFVLRRTKREVARELPLRTDLVLRCELDDRQRQVYDAVRAATQEEVVEKLQAGGSVLAVLEALLRLRQAACHPALLPGQGDLAGHSSAKIELLLENLDEVLAEGHKALVFSQWTSLLDLVEPHLRRLNVDFTRLDGSTKNRQQVVDRFQDPAGPPVMLISLKAGGTGLNLTAADNVFLLDPWWNPAVEDQAADRAHRIGQENPVFVHRLVARDTVEERILQLQERKRTLAQAALGEAGQTHELSREELLALLE